MTGSQHVAIDSASAQLNDVLQPMIVMDENRGRIAGANCIASTPVEEPLKWLSLAMSDDPEFAARWNTRHGKRVEAKGASGGATIGMLRSIASRSEKAPDADAAGD